MRRKDTAKILKEWKSFLYENKNPKFDESHVDKEVIVTYCCDECIEYLKKQNIKNRSEGVIVSVDLNNIEINNKEYNTCLVKLDKDKDKQKMIPDICVHLKDDIKEKNILEDKSRTPRKKGQPAGSDKHSDLFVDEDPEGTIKGLGFKDAATAKKGVAKVNKAKRTHAHKVQATQVMKQRANAVKDQTKDPEKKKNLNAAFKIWSNHLEKLKDKTKKQKKEKAKK